MIQTEIPKEIKDAAPKRGTPVLKLVVIIAVSILIISFISWQFKPKEPVNTTENNNPKYHAPVQLTSNYPKELFVENVSNEKTSLENGNTQKTTYTYDSKNSPAKVFELYKATLTKNGWKVSSGSKAILKASKGGITVSITADVLPHGSAVSVVLKNEKK